MRNLVEAEFRLGLIGKISSMACLWLLNFHIFWTLNFESRSYRRPLPNCSRTTEKSCNALNLICHYQQITDMYTLITY